MSNGREKKSDSGRLDPLINSEDGGPFSDIPPFLDVVSLLRLSATNKELRAAIDFADLCFERFKVKPVANINALLCYATLAMLTNPEEISDSILVNVILKFARKNLPKPNLFVADPTHQRLYFLARLYQYEINRNSKNTTTTKLFLKKACIPAVCATPPRFEVLELVNPLHQLIISQGCVRDGTKLFKTVLEKCAAPETSESKNESVSSRPRESEDPESNTMRNAIRAEAHYRLATHYRDADEEVNTEHWEKALALRHPQMYLQAALGAMSLHANFEYESKDEPTETERQKVAQHQDTFIAFFQKALEAQEPLAILLRAFVVLSSRYPGQFNHAHLLAELYNRHPGLKLIDPLWKEICDKSTEETVCADLEKLMKSPVAYIAAEYLMRVHELKGDRATAEKYLHQRLMVGASDSTKVGNLPHLVTEGGVCYFEKNCNLRILSGSEAFVRTYPTDQVIYKVLRDSQIARDVSKPLAALFIHTPGAVDLKYFPGLAVYLVDVEKNSTLAKSMLHACFEFYPQNPNAVLEYMQAILSGTIRRMNESLRASGSESKERDKKTDVQESPTRSWASLFSDKDANQLLCHARYSCVPRKEFANDFFQACEFMSKNLSDEKLRQECHHVIESKMSDPKNYLDDCLPHDLLAEYHGREHLRKFSSEAEEQKSAPEHLKKAIQHIKAIVRRSPNMDTPPCYELLLELTAAKPIPEDLKPSLIQVWKYMAQITYDEKNRGKAFYCLYQLTQKDEHLAQAMSLNPNAHFDRMAAKRS